MKAAFLAFALLTAALIAAAVVLIDRDHDVAGWTLLVAGLFGWLSMLSMIMLDARGETNQE